MPLVNKEIFFETLICPAYGWHLRHANDKPPSLADQFRMEEGKKIHRRARALYSDGIFTTDVTKTATLLADPTVNTIFESEFQVDVYVTRADILRREGDGWHLIEVKSNVNDDDELVDDLTYTAMVLRRSGVNLVRCSLMLISKDYRIGMLDDALFVQTDHTDDVMARADEYDKQWESVSNIINRADQPKPKLIWDCRKCDRFKADCLGVGVTNHIFDLPRISEKKFNELTAMDVTTIDRIPCDYDLTPNQCIVRTAVRSRKPVIQISLVDDLSAIHWPAYYLDFETFKTAIPLYPDVAPHEAILTQYSIHNCSAPGQVDDHREYLADPSRDCRRELAEQLIADLGNEGSIVTYSPYEKTMINKLAELFPDLAKPLRRCIGRLYDLKNVLSKAYYHPGFHGSYSIKNVLPVLVPEMTYEGMDIGDGDLASAIFAQMAMGRFSKGEMEKIRKDLLTYCGQDTLAMVILHKQLLNAL